MVKVEVSETERCVYLPGVGTQQVTRFITPASLERFVFLSISAIQAL